MDLSDQLNLTCPAQGKTGSCHAFAATGMLEAAIKRRHGRLVTLSSADLFTRVALAKNRVRIFETEDGDATVTEIEIGRPEEGMSFALKEGIAYEETASWADFLDAYAEEKEARAERCEEIAGEAESAACRRLGLREYLEELKDEDSAAREKRLLGASPKLAAERRETKALLSGLSVTNRSRYDGHFDPAAIRDPLDRAVCREKGRKQTELLVARLDERLPVAVCFAMDNLPGWDGDKKKESGNKHCVIVRGYRSEGEGPAARKSFQVRNSWGSFQAVRVDARGIPSFASVEVTHDIHEDHACAITSASWISP